MIKMGTNSRPSYMREILDLVGGDVLKFIIFLLIIYIIAIMALAVMAEKARESLKNNYSVEKEKAEKFKKQTDDLNKQLDKFRLDLESVLPMSEEERKNPVIIINQIKGEIQNIQNGYKDELDKNKTLIMQLQQLNVVITQLKDENQILKKGTDVQNYVELLSRYQALQKDYVTSGDQLQKVTNLKRELLLEQINAKQFESLGVDIELKDVEDSRRKREKEKEITNALREIVVRKTSDKRIDEETQTAIEEHAQDLFDKQASRLMAERNQLNKREQELITLDRLVQERREEIIKNAGPFSFPLYNKENEINRITEAIKKLIPKIGTWDKQNIDKIEVWARQIYDKLQKENNTHMGQIQTEKRKVEEVVNSILEQKKGIYYKKIKLNSSEKERATIIKDITAEITKALESKVNLVSFDPESKLFINQEAEIIYSNIISEKQSRKEGMLGKIGLITPGDIRKEFPEGRIPTSGSKDKVTQQIYKTILQIAGTGGSGTDGTGTGLGTVGIGEGNSELDDDIKQSAMKRAVDVYNATMAVISLGVALKVDWIIICEEINTGYGREGCITIDNWDLRGQEKQFPFKFGSRENIKESMERILNEINQQIVYLLYTGMKEGRKIEFKVHSRVIGMLIPQYVEDSLIKTLSKIQAQEKGRFTFNVTREFRPE